MIHLIGLALMATGVAAAPYVKKAIKKIQDDEKNKEIIELETNIESKNPIVVTKQNNLEKAEEKHNYHFALTSATASLAVVAPYSGIVLLTPISLVLIGYTSVTIFNEAFTALFKDKKIKVDILDSIVISASVLFGHVAVAAFMVWVLAVADLLLDKTKRKSKEYITDIFGEQARYAWLMVNGAEIQIEVKNLKENDIIIIGTGEQIPVDGLIVEGEATIDQQSLTGEATPVDKDKDDEVFAMTTMVAGKIHVKVSKTGADTLASKIIQIINEASNYEVKVQSSGEKMADTMVLPTLGLGAIGYATTGSNALLAILNADYGTGIRVAAPIGLLASLGVAAKNGLLIKDSKVFELLKDIDVVLFDKTGTLTSEIPKVSRIVSADKKYSEELILHYTASAEQKFSHPIATAIINKAKEDGLELAKLKNSEYYVGLGIEVTINGDLVKVGSGRYMDKENIKIPSNIAEELEETLERGQIGILISINYEIAGMIELSANVREESAQVIEDLRKHGIKEIIMISGDHDAPTKKLAKELNIDRYFAGVLPHEKADYVKLLQDEGKKVMMVGDGINDSAALSYADIGVSLKGASTIAVDVADVIFMDGSLKKFNHLFKVSNIMQENVKRSFYLIAIPNTLCIVGALGGIFGLKASLILNNGFNIIASANGMTPYMIDLNKEKENKKHD